MSISVILCNGERNRDLWPALRAALRQEYKDPFEVILIDDATGNATLPPLKTLPIRILIKDRPRGWVDSLRKAVETARYDILAFTDSHCIVPRDWLSTIRRGLTNRDLLTGNLRHGDRFRERFSQFFTHFDFAPAQRGVAPFINDGNAAFRRDFLTQCLQALPADEAISGGTGCVLLGKAVSKRGIPIWRDPELVVHHKSETFSESLRLWFSEYGPNTLNIRRFSSRSRGAGFLRLGMMAPLVLAGGKWATMHARLIASWKRFGIRFYELPLCVCWFSLCTLAYCLGMLTYLAALRVRKRPR